MTTDARFYPIQTVSSWITGKEAGTEMLPRLLARSMDPHLIPHEGNRPHRAS